MTKIKKQSAETPSGRSNFDTTYLYGSRTAYCVLCRKVVPFLSLQVSAELLETKVEVVEKLAKRGEIHRAGKHEAEALICSFSLISSFGSD
jgi:hypothetical protein